MPRMIRLVSHTAPPTLSPATLRRPIAIPAARPTDASPAISPLHLREPRVDLGSAVVSPDARPEERHAHEARDAQVPVGCWGRPER